MPREVALEDPTGLEGVAVVVVAAVVAVVVVVVVAVAAMVAAAAVASWLEKACLLRLLRRSRLATWSPAT